ncbi:hypothetical protein LTR37_008374 [Vermiconidia calcicola]|uniref:Uncharacterized protein n=1 Tax=Vermiconidia calcicola TaxID=1690605 RepID=A0ACC3NB32_9PEZI|nr:hypothetical protein LTR37_008374 [Vermiconidia calcicola]
MASHISPVVAIAVALVTIAAFIRQLPALRKTPWVNKIISKINDLGNGFNRARTARPVVLVGLNEAVGRRVSAHLMPEYEVVLEVFSISRAKAELTRINRGQKPCTDGDNVGTHNFSRMPKHVIFSKGYREKKVQEVRDALGGTNSGICWYWTPILPGEQLPNPTQIDEQQANALASMIAGHIKRTMNGVVERGEEGKDGFYEL